MIFCGGAARLLSPGGGTPAVTTELSAARISAGEPSATVANRNPVWRFLIRPPPSLVPAGIAAPALFWARVSTGWFTVALTDPAKSDLARIHGRKASNNGLLVVRSPAQNGASAR